MSNDEKIRLIKDLDGLGYEVKELEDFDLSPHAILEQSAKADEGSVQIRVTLSRKRAIEGS